MRVHARRLERGVEPNVFAADHLKEALEISRRSAGDQKEIRRRSEGNNQGELKSGSVIYVGGKQSNGKSETNELTERTNELTDRCGQEWECDMREISICVFWRAIGGNQHLCCCEAGRELT